MTYATGPAEWDQVSVDEGTMLPAWQWNHIVVTHYLHDLGGVPGSPEYDSHVGTIPRVVIHVNNLLAATGSAPMPHNTSRTDCHLGRGAGLHRDDEHFRGVVRDLYVANYPIGAVSRHFLADPEWQTPGPSPPHAPPPPAGAGTCDAPIQLVTLASPTRPGSADGETPTPVDIDVSPSVDVDASAATSRRKLREHQQPGHTPPAGCEVDLHTGVEVCTLQAMLSSKAMLGGKVRRHKYAGGATPPPEHTPERSSTPRRRGLQSSSATSAASSPDSSVSGFITSMLGGNSTSRLGVKGGSSITLEGTFPDPDTVVTQLRVGKLHVKSLATPKLPTFIAGLLMLTPTAPNSC